MALFKPLFRFPFIQNVNKHEEFLLLDDVEKIGIKYLFIFEILCYQFLLFDF